jgi:hypothetical protein
LKIQHQRNFFLFFQLTAHHQKKLQQKLVSLSTKIERILNEEKPVKYTRDEKRKYKNENDDDDNDDDCDSHIGQNELLAYRNITTKK